MQGKKALKGSSQHGGSAVDVSSVFSTYLYTGNGSTQTINNGIDLAGEGGMVWVKGRSSLSSHYLFDTNRGSGKYLETNSTGTGGDIGTIQTFTSSGFTIGGTGELNANLSKLSSWTFRKAPRFFDIVTYTGNGVSGRTIAHSLGIKPGFIIIKRTDTAANWVTRHVAGGNVLYLNTTGAEGSLGYAGGFPDMGNETTFGVRDTVNPNDLSLVNASGGTYVAYIYAHDPLGASGDGSDGMIACGSYTGTGVAGVNVDLGWEPQYVLVKQAAGTGTNDWCIYDSMRGTVVGATLDDNRLSPNNSNTETGYPEIAFTSTGFVLESAGSRLNTNAATYIYMAIRRPMKTPESSDEVYNATYAYEYDIDGNVSASNGIHGYLGSPTDLFMQGYVGGGSNLLLRNRLTASNYLVTSGTAAEVAGALDFWDNNVGSGFVTANSINTSLITYNFKRAKGFFDVVAYTGNGIVGRTVDHNLGVEPEMIWVKYRNAAAQWHVYQKDMGITKLVWLNGNDAEVTSSPFHTVPTSTVFYLDNAGDINGTGGNFIAYLFTTLAGISKVGSYTGNGTSQTIDAGFSTGAKFILIKRTDSTGDWYIWDSVRGIVAGNDPHLSLNTTSAEVTTDDSIDPDNSGFIVNQNATTNINVTSATYIYYSIATPI